MSRTILRKNQQSKFLNRVGQYFDFDWPRIARISDICERSLRDWRKERNRINHEALLKLHKISKIPVPKILKILPEHWSAKKFARLGGLSHYQIYGDFGTPEGRRKGGVTSQRLFRLNPDYARRIGVTIRKAIKKPKLSIDLSEFIGIALGDGGITEHQVVITFNKKTDLKYAGYIRKLIKKLFLISSTMRLNHFDNAGSITASSKNLVEFLKEKGLKRGNKLKNKIDIPRWILDNKNYGASCLRGLVDTDGSFYQHRHRRAVKYYVYFTMCFTNYSRPLLNSAYNILRSLRISCVRSGNHIYIYKREEIDRYFKIIGTSNPKHLEKYKKYSVTSAMKPAHCYHQ